MHIYKEYKFIYYYLHILVGFIFSTRIAFIKMIEIIHISISHRRSPFSIWFNIHAISYTFHESDVL